MTSEAVNREKQILDAARKVFTQKGCAGARMQEIADEAGINKALLHYYFRSKDKLFEAVFYQAASSFLPAIKDVIEKEMPIEQKIVLLVNTYMDILQANPYVPAFVIQELNTDPGRFVGMLSMMGIKPEPMLRQIEEEIELGRIRKVKPDHLLINLMGMCLFPFIARPVVKGLLHMNDAKYQEFLSERKEEVIQFILNSIKA